MKLKLLLTLLLAGLCLPLMAQLHFNGRWQGRLIDGNEKYPIELILKRDGRYIHGRSFLTLSDTLTLEMNVQGIWHQDQSFNLYEMKLVWPQDLPEEEKEIMRRTYQILYRRSFNDASMKGWWQERGKKYNDQSRRAGRLELTPVLPDKA